MKQMQEMQAMMKALVEEKEAKAEKDVKAEIKRMFVDELMRRQAVSGTFEITEGERQNSDMKSSEKSLRFSIMHWLKKFSL